MHTTIRNKVTYGFLILALGMMLTDVCRLLTPSADSSLPISHARAQVLTNLRGSEGALHAHRRYRAPSDARALNSPRHVSDQRDEEKHDENEE